MKKKINIGDIFSVPIESDRLVYGQIVERYQKVLFYCVFFSHLLTKEIKRAPSDILLAGITTSARIESGDWQTISNEVSGLDDIARPHYKIVISGKTYVEDLSERIRRTIEEEEADILSFRSIVAPIRYEKALCAHFGVGEWQQPYDKLLYENVIRSHEIPLK